MKEMMSEAIDRTPLLYQRIEQLKEKIAYRDKCIEELQKVIVELKAIIEVGKPCSTCSPFSYQVVYKEKEDEKEKMKMKMNGG